MIELKGDFTHDGIYLERCEDGDLKVSWPSFAIKFSRQQEEELLGWLLRWVKSDQRPRPLRTVDEHNAKAMAEREEWDKRHRRTGVACPKCSKELTWSSCGWRISTLDQTVREASCLSCQLVIDLEGN